MEQFGEPEAPAKTLFDKNKPQKMAFIKEDDDSRYELEFTIKNLSDDLLAEFDKLSFIKVENDGDNQIFTADDLDACDWFFNTNAELTGGFEGELWQDWRDSFGLLERQSIVRTFLEGSIQSSEKVKFKSAFSREKSAAFSEKKIVLTANFNGEELELTHHLPADLDKYLRKFIRITQDLVSKKGKTGTFLPETFIKLGRLYDSMGITAAGYTEGGIPLHHKSLVLREVFGKQAETHKKK